jgi:hypothetical protein
MDDQRGMTTPPNFRGVSGSPYGFVHRDASRQDLLHLRMPKLVGVAIEVQKHAIIATRLSILLQFIRQQVERPTGAPLPGQITANSLAWL